MDEPNPPTNRLALISLAAAILTVLSFCGGVAPVPLTGWFCYPGAIFLGLIALLTGIPALRQIRASGERGRGMALLGAWLGGLTILATICAVILAVYTVAALGGEIWKQIQPGLFPTPTP